MLKTQPDVRAAQEALARQALAHSAAYISKTRVAPERMAPSPTQGQGAAAQPVDKPILGH